MRFLSQHRPLNSAQSRRIKLRNLWVLASWVLNLILQLTLLGHDFRARRQYILIRSASWLGCRKNVTGILLLIWGTESIFQIYALVLHGWHWGHPLSQLRGFCLFCFRFDLYRHLELLLLCYRTHLITLKIQGWPLSIERGSFNFLCGILVKCSNNRILVRLLLQRAHIEVLTIGESPIYSLLVPFFEPQHLFAARWLFLMIKKRNLFIILNLLGWIAIILFCTVWH